MLNKCYRNRSSWAQDSLCLKQQSQESDLISNQWKLWGQKSTQINHYNYKYFINILLKLEPKQKIYYINCKEQDKFPCLKDTFMQRCHLLQMMTLSFPTNTSRIYHGQHVVPSFLTSLFSQQSRLMILLNLNPTFILNAFPQTVGSFPHLRCWFHQFGTYYVHLIWEVLALFQRIRTIIGVAAVKLCSDHF